MPRPYEVPTISFPSGDPRALTEGDPISEIISGERPWNTLDDVGARKMLEPIRAVRPDLSTTKA